MSCPPTKKIIVDGDVNTNLETNNVGVVKVNKTPEMDPHSDEEQNSGQINKSVTVPQSQNLETLLLNHPHPLLIPHIIESVFDYLFGKQVNRHIPDLRNCRQVCSRWNEICNKIYRKYSEELVLGESGTRRDSRKLEQFISDMEHSFDNPIQSYRFEPGFFIQKNAPLFKNFLYSCSHWIVTLKLWFDNQSDLKFQKRCYPDLKLDSLEYLFFGCVNYRGKCCSDKMELTYVLDALLGASTRMKKFCFSFPPKDTRSQQGMIKRFGDLISSKIPKTVKNLKLEMKLTNEQMQGLTEIGLALEILHCDFRGSAFKPGVILGLLTQQSSTLQQIRLLDSEIKYAYEVKFPRFEKLKVCELQGGKIQEFSYRDHFPVLERLLLFGWENQKTSSSMLQSTTACETMTNLELPYKIRDKNMIHLAAKCFPNLKKLEITPIKDGMEVLGKVFQYLVQLEELEITFPFIIDTELNVDPIFTGMSLQDCEMLNSYSSDDGLSSVDVPSFQRNPSITNLTKLKRLTILDHSNEIRLTDVTAFFGFLKLDSLEVLEMGRFNISSKMLQALKDKVRLTENYESSDSGSEFNTSDDSSLSSWEGFGMLGVLYDDCN